MSKPLVAIVGRPNVGKSTFFNRIVGQRISIVEDTPGVTRDRLYADAEWCGHSFTLIDTGGLEIKSEDVMWSHIRAQAQIAVETADVIVFMLDGKTGLTHEDYEVAAYLRKSRKPILLVVNKLDNNEQHLLYDFYELGLGEPIGISAGQAKGLGDVLDEIVKLTGKYETEEKEEALKIAVVGKPNAGKSSLVNKLLGYDRVIVSDIAGTTRDAIDTRIKIGDKEYILIDTAGIRRKRSVEEDLEQYSVMRSLGGLSYRHRLVRGTVGTRRQNRGVRSRTGQTQRRRHEQVGRCRKGHLYNRKVQQKTERRTQIYGLLHSNVRFGKNGKARG